MNLKDKLSSVSKIAKDYLIRIYDKIENSEKVSEEQLEEIRKNPYLCNMNTFPKV